MHKKISTIANLSNPLILILNIALLVLCAGGLAYYVSGSNALASSEYKVSSMQKEMAALNVQQSQLSAEKSNAEDPAAALAYAQAQGMVSAQDIVYVFENGNVALQR